MSDLIRIKHLCKYFGRIQAVDDLSFQVKEGELFAFLGINGAGKSTTINILCGQLPKDSGTVTICGADLEVDADRIKSSIGVVFQNSVCDVLYSPCSCRFCRCNRDGIYDHFGNAGAVPYHRCHIKKQGQVSVSRRNCDMLSSLCVFVLQHIGVDSLGMVFCGSLYWCAAWNNGAEVNFTMQVAIAT